MRKLFIFLPVEKNRDRPYFYKKSSKKKWGLSLFFLLVVLCALAWAAGEIEVTASVDKEEVAIGGRVELTVTARNIKGMDVLFPERPENLGAISFIESRPVKSRRIGPKTAGMVYALGIYETGTHVIPPVKVRYKPSGEADWRVLETRQIPIEIRSLLTGGDTDIKDIKDLAVFGTYRLLVVLIVVFLVFAAALIAWALWQRKQKTQNEKLKTMKPAHEIAYEELSRLKSMDLPKQGKVKEHYIRLSDIARHYLENRFSYRAPEMTTEEFLNYIKNALELGQEQRELLKKFLTHCDMVKFARYGPTPLEVVDSFHLAELLVDQTRLVEEETEKSDAVR